MSCESCVRVLRRVSQVILALIVIVLIAFLLVPLIMLLPSRLPKHLFRKVSVQSQAYRGELMAYTTEEYIEGPCSGAPARPWFMRSGCFRPNKSDVHAKLFPEDAPGEDRIVEQLMYILPENRKAAIKKIYIEIVSGWRMGHVEFKRNRCPVDRCVLTANPMDEGSADAILFQDYYSTSLPKKRHKNQIWILYYTECPYNTLRITNKSVGRFNWTATYRRDSEIVAPYGRWVYHNPLVTENNVTRNIAANKTKKVVWFVSNCSARRRLEYAKSLAKYISVDIYGSCGSLFCYREDPECWRMLDRDYKFYLAFENSNCQDYITEKFFFNGLRHNILPIVMGARAAEYAAVAPHNSYIHVEEFAGPKELAEYMHLLDKDDNLYNSYFKWKGTGEFINTYFMCRVCAMVHAAEQRKRVSNYKDVSAWWRNGTCREAEWRTLNYKNDTLLN